MSGLDRIRTRIAVTLGVTLLRGLRLIGSGATTLPGKVALRIDPKLLRSLSTGVPVLVVTGTNGKTTTTRMLCAILRGLGWAVVTNRSGANLKTGLATTLLENRKKLRAPRTVAVLEIDEAAFRRVAAGLDPKVVVVTNLFRDQLDRFGELATTLRFLSEGLDACAARLVTDADDSLCASLGRGREARTLFYGFEPAAMLPPDAVRGTEATHCLFCGAHYVYRGRTYGHLGDFACPSCGYARPASALSCRGILSEDGTGTRALFVHGEEARETDIPVPGRYNVYNALAATATALAFGEDFAAVLSHLPSSDTGFGRMELIRAGDRSIRLILVKNPAGFDQAVEFLCAAKDVGAALFVLNDNIADGTDVSWIWDADIERLAERGRVPPLVGASGKRVQDMALRLVYAGVPADRLRTGENAHALLKELLAACPPDTCLYVLPTYTAMLALRARLASDYGLAGFWE